jgi:hypothetical protein
VIVDTYPADGQRIHAERVLVRAGKPGMHQRQ